MERCVVLGSLVIIGALSMTVAAFQQPPQPAEKVIDVDKLKDNLFVLKGAAGIPPCCTPAATRSSFSAPIV